MLSTFCLKNISKHSSKILLLRDSNVALQHVENLIEIVLKKSTNNVKFNEHFSGCRQGRSYNDSL